MKREQRPPRSFRLRDVLGFVAVMLMCAALIYTAFTRGAPPSGSLSLAAFLVGGGMLTVAYGAGWMLDAVGRRYPFLTRVRHSPVTFAVLVPVLVVALYFAWRERDQVWGNLKESSHRIVTVIDDQREYFGLP